MLFITHLWSLLGAWSFNIDFGYHFFFFLPLAPSPLVHTPITEEYYATNLLQTQTQKRTESRVFFQNCISSEQADRRSSSPQSGSAKQK